MIRGLVVVLGGWIAPAVVCAQLVSGDVVAVGFRAAGGSHTGFLVREGQWTPVQVRLSVQGSRYFHGQLRVESADLDGDLVSWVEAPVIVTPEAGIKLAWCYAVWLPPPTVTPPPQYLGIYSDDDVLIARRPVPAFDVVPHDTMLILDISDKPLAPLRALESATRTPSPYFRNVTLAAMSAAELPDRWFGLEAVDVLVWDEPNPAAVSPAQLEALREWVHNGGQLVLGLGQSWTTIGKTELVELLPLQPPADGAGRAAGAWVTIETRRLPQFFDSFVDPAYQSGQTERTFKAPVTVAVAEAKPGAVRAVRSLVAGDAAVDLIAAQWLGSGRVIAAAASLRNLMQVPVTPMFHAQFFDLNPTTKEFRESETGSLLMGFGRHPLALYEAVTQPTSFTGWSAVLVLAAFAFVVMYIGLAALMSWAWLRHYALTSLSWVFFAVFAVVAGGISLGTVWGLRGVQRGVGTFACVDLEAGSRVAAARCFFGYSSPSRVPTDLSLSGDGGWLRPLAVPRRQSAYAAAARYTALPHKAALLDVPRRATLKQFEGLWCGQLPGSVRTELLADRATGELTPGSWIQNDLDVDFEGGYLLYLDPRFPDDGFPWRPAGKTSNWWKRGNVPPAGNILAVELPPLRAGGKLSGPGQRTYEAVRRQRLAWSQSPDRQPQSFPDLPNLYGEQQAWAGQADTAFPSLRPILDLTLRHALLASTRNFYLPCDADFKEYAGFPLTTGGLMNLDVSHWLMQGRVRAPAGHGDDLLVGQGLLLLAAAAPGPAKLLAEDRPLGPLTGRSLYRIRVPIALLGQPPTAPGGGQP